MRFWHDSLQVGLIVLSCTVAGVAWGQHRDILLQSDGNQIAIGVADFLTFDWSLGNRVFARDFDRDYLIENPGFNALGADSSFLPDGYFALPASSPIGWDFLPMKFESGVMNLAYWDGTDTNGNGVDSLDVSFAPLAGSTISLAGAGGTAIADGSSQIVVGPKLAMTDVGGELHTHRDFRLNDGDGNPATDPLDGIYLVALRMKMATLEPSDPLFIVFGTPGSMLEERNAAVAWVEERIDTLVPFGLPGDYNDDGAVDAADYTVWRDHLGPGMLVNEDPAASPLIVDSADYTVWKSNFGMNLPMPGAAAMLVPEPSSMPLCLAGLFFVGTRRPARSQLYFAANQAVC